ncbi:hypothetical protein EB796_017895 [Bugula neritina]|uniref:Uncharacterized protein n=1 Tax=Bugula neritina TaxID=10212 RepID=A0A7J7JCY8_BUGNE|nr:hypothetical protein EB796_017895 [Bugula neritina]
MYSRWFIENLQYLKSLKLQFDKAIYEPLQEKHKSIFGALVESSIMELKEDIEEIKELYSETNKDNVISRLKYLHERLEYLLEDEGEVDPIFFSLTSAQSLERNCQANGSFVRLVPDILKKMNKAGLLAEQWLHVLAVESASGEQRLGKLERVKTLLSDRLTNVNGEIGKIEKELDSESGELQNLLEREDRSVLIADRAKSLEQKLNKLHERVLQTYHQITDIRDLVKTAGGNDKFTTKLMADLKKKQKLHDEMSGKLKVAKYEKKLVEEDLSLELEIKPNLIRLTNGLQEKCEQLEVALDLLYKEREKIERAIKPVVDTVSMET